MSIRKETVTISTSWKRIAPIKAVLQLLPKEYKWEVSALSDHGTVVIINLEWDTAVGDAFFIGQWIGFLIMDIKSLDQFGRPIQDWTIRKHSNDPMQLKSDG